MLRLALAFALLPFAALAQDRIALPDGATTTQVAGQAGDGAEMRYLLNAQEGQTLSLTLDAPDQSTAFAIFPPGEQAASFIGGRVGTAFSAVLPKSGDYAIVVTRSGSAADFALDVAVTNEMATGAPVLPQ
ncbi:hypothetical protein [Falsirhodobacter deserti]|uniref:hypothetical protein n=1 Tax=Falsirhodobacter deserti TaxID=1365611 RepID=UPI000FE2BEE4|nr:hypothetical protein [Falsirhodobacter deserti]